MRSSTGGAEDKPQSVAEQDYFSTMSPTDLNFDSDIDSTVWGGAALNGICLFCLWSWGTLLRAPDLPLPHPLTTTTGSAVEVAGLDEIDNRQKEKKSALWVDLRRVQLLLKDACLSDGDLLSTGTSTDLFR